MSEDTAEKDALAPMLADGFDHHEHEHLKPGVRVRNRGEQYDKARQFGTAEVVAVLRKPGSWEQTYGRLNIEVLVRRDGGSLSWWADYGTFLPEGCWSCGVGGCCCHVIPPGRSEAQVCTCGAWDDQDLAHAPDCETYDFPPAKTEDAD